MNVVVAGGGTGGHFFPGLAVAQEFVRTQGGSVTFVGSDDGIEARAAGAHGFPFVAVRMRAFRGGGMAGQLRAVGRLLPAVAAAWKALRALDPALVIGLGSYASVPVVLAAWLRRIPIVLLEQNVVPGFANRLLGRFARQVCAAFAASEPYFPAGRTVLTGNPVRVLRTATRPDPTRFTVFAFGGSQGAHSLNVALVGAAAALRQAVPNLSIIHQTGRADAAEVTAAYRAAGVEAEVSAFIDDMAGAYGRADLIVSRAGASTLAEVAAVGKPAILVPYPVAADDHQRKNAEVLVARGAAVMILDRDLSGASLAAQIRGLAFDGPRRAAMAAAVGGLAIPDAAQRVLAVCRSVAAGAR